MDDITRKHFMNILDTFTGADGGVRFTNFRFLVEDLCDLENEECKLLISLIHQFSRLINAAQERG